MGRVIEDRDGPGSDPWHESVEPHGVTICNALDSAESCGRNALAGAVTLWQRLTYESSHRSRRYTARHPGSYGDGEVGKNAQQKNTDSMEVTEEWAVAVGWSVIGFGNIEQFLTTMIQYFASETFADSTKKLQLSDRLRVLDGLLQSVGLTAREASRWSQIYKKIDKLREDYRNPLAHGAPLPFI